MHTNILSPFRSVLLGHKLLVVGGDRRDEALSRLKRAFELVEVLHCRTRSSDPSPKCFSSRIHDPGIVLVVVALGLARTSRIREVHRLCRELGTPWVDCQRIPHPNSLAAAIERLRLLDALHARHRLLASIESVGSSIGGGA